MDKELMNHVHQVKGQTIDGLMKMCDQFSRARFAIESRTLDLILADNFNENWDRFFKG